MDATPQLGSLRPVELRSVWRSEPTDFTPWLAKNLDRLGEELELGGLRLIEEEHRVGSFSLDLLAELDDGRLVAIENQLERSDHTHLGQCLTYAAGVGASAIVWVLPTLAAEHRAALDWLNEHTDDEVHFFGVEVSVVQIGESLPAPVFTVLSRPNEWQKAVRTRAGKKSGAFRDWQVGYDALRSLSGPEWTSIHELAELVGTSPGWVGRHFYNRRHEPETIRMFMDDGSIWSWARHDSGNPPTTSEIAAELVSMGVVLGAGERARPENFVGVEDLRARLGVDQPAGPSGEGP